MSLKKKILAAGLAVCMAAIMVTGMTLAYFTDQESETNTFTVGKVDIELTEPQWKADPNNKDLIPGKTIPKDPTITVASGSQTAYTFMKVQLSEDFMDLLKAYATAEKITDPSALIDDWFESEVGPKVMYTDTDEGYVILGVLSPKKANESVTYFDAVKIPTGVKQEMIKANGTYTITVTAYAIQAEGFYNEADKQASRQAAFNAMFPELATTVTP
ncbi:hypothetical protein B5G43_15820 [Flavonifractor sp. An92]|uniref:TasA family protein n=1 Tax=Flavonifractor sp. An92 TaxID=1965666 RepID=UPI000B37C17E|nr:TasA family protein [Flavonifractor sp. An92]OUN02731.1 hypothetical protein B5G43_15820 [Flavonifractor sp. An92]